jgi:hypothetical protein
MEEKLQSPGSKHQGNSNHPASVPGGSVWILELDDFLELSDRDLELLIAPSCLALAKMFWS